MDQYLIGLSCLDCLGPVNTNKLIELFGTPEAVWRASFFNLKKIGVPLLLAQKIIKQKQEVNLPATLKLLEREKIYTISLFEPDYPPLLKAIYSPPPLLYYRGNIECFKQKVNLAVVGSRKISAYCQNTLPKILLGALNKKITIISGLAFGVDALSHELALKAKTKTIGVLASGLLWEDFYPKTNIKLAEKILEQNGLIISEFPPLRKAFLFNFPRRNRIIAGLANAVLIAEAAGKSGALITADYALDFNRDVLAIPQNISSPNAPGVNKLIQKGAALIASSNDLLQALNFPIKENFQQSLQLDLAQEEKIVYCLLNDAPLHIDKIIEASKLTPAKVNGLLMQLELKELVKNCGNQQYIKL